MFVLFYNKIRLFLGGKKPYESKTFTFTTATQCVPFDSCKLTILTLLEKGPSRK